MRNSSKMILGAAAAAVVASLVPATVRATDYTWGGSTGAQSWDNAANWSPNTGFPNAIADTANFQVPLGANLNVTLNVPITVGGLSLGSTTTGATDIGAGSTVNALTLDNTGAVNNNSDGNANPFILSSGSSVNTISAPVWLSAAGNNTTNIVAASTTGLNLSGGLVINSTTGASQTRALQDNISTPGADVHIGAITSSSTGTPTANITNVLQIGQLNNSTTTQWGTVYLDGVISNGAQVAGFNVNTQVLFGQAGNNSANTIGTVVVSGNNTFSGGARLFRANVVLGSDTALGTGSVQYGSGAASGAMGFNLASTDDARTIANNLTMQRNLTINGSHSLTWNGTVTQSNSSNLFNLLPTGKTFTIGNTVFTDNASAGGKSFTFDGSGDTVVTGDVQDTSNATAGVNGAVVKNGSGTVTLDGTASALTYHNFTAVNGGVLRLGNLGVGNTSSVTVNPGGTIVLGSGTISSTLTSKIVASQAQNSAGALGLTAGDAAAAIDFTTGDLSNAKAAGMSVGADVGGVTYTGTITPPASGYRLGGGGTLTMGGAANQLTGANALSVVNGGTVALTQTNDYSGNTTLQGNYIVTAIQQAAANNGTLVLPGTYVTPTLRVSQVADGASSLGSGSSVAINGGTLSYVGSTNQSSSKALSIGPTGATLDSSGAGAVTYSGTVTSTDVPGTITGNTAASNPTITSVSDISNLAVGMTVNNANVPAGATIVSINPRFTVTSNQPNALTYDVRLSANATAAATGTTLTFTTQNRALNLTGSNAGNNTVSGALADSAGGTLAVNKSGAGTWVLGGANTYTGGTTVNAGKLVAAHSAAFANGALNIADGATAQIQSGLANAVAVTTLNTNSTGQMDVTNGKMVVRGSTAAAVTAQIVSGFNGGAWNGPGVNSSTAAADANGLTAIGYASNADYGASDFYGVSGLTANDVLVRYTYYGDADLSGDVTLDDFSQFLNGYQTQSAATNNWLNGDFDYDGHVTLDDFSQFLFGYQHQGAPLGALESMIASSSLSAADKAAMMADIQAVPEPTSLALLGLAGAGLLAGRRRRK